MFDRLKYAACNVATALGGIFSRSVNALFFRGSMHQSISARAHIEGRRSAKWARRERLIDRLFFWERHHCAVAWIDEVARARRTLELNEATED